MAQINTSLSERRRKAKGFKSKRIAYKIGEIPQVVDVLFIGLQAQVGEVVTIASPEGRAAVEKIFNGLQVEWCEPRVNPGDAFPSDWLEFNFVIPGIVEGCAEHRLPAPLFPEHILKLRTMDEMSADHFACLMVFAANHQGVRAAMFSEFSQEITIVHPKNLFN
jgi:hypothetical protein